VSQNKAARKENNRLEKVCSLEPDGTDSKKTNKWGCFWNALDRMSLKMTKRIL